MIVTIMIVTIMIIIPITTRARTGILAGNHNSRVESSANGKERVSLRLSQLKRAISQLAQLIMK